MSQMMMVSSPQHVITGPSNGHPVRTSATGATSATTVTTGGSSATMTGTAMLPRHGHMMEGRFPQAPPPPHHGHHGAHQHHAPTNMPPSRGSAVMHHGPPPPLPPRSEEGPFLHGRGGSMAQPQPRFHNGQSQRHHREGCMPSSPHHHAHRRAPPPPPQQQQHSQGHHHRMVGGPPPSRGMMNMHEARHSHVCGPPASAPAGAYGAPAPREEGPPPSRSLYPGSPPPPPSLSARRLSAGEAPRMPSSSHVNHSQPSRIHSGPNSSDMVSAPMPPAQQQHPPHRPGQQPPVGIASSPHHHHHHRVANHHPHPLHVRQPPQPHGPPLVSRQAPPPHMIERGMAVPPPHLRGCPPHFADGFGAAPVPPPRHHHAHVHPSLQAPASPPRCSWNGQHPPSYGGAPNVTGSSNLMPPSTPTQQYLPLRDPEDLHATSPVFPPQTQEPAKAMSSTVPPPTVSSEGSVVCSEEPNVVSSSSSPAPSCDGNSSAAGSARDGAITTPPQEQPAPTAEITHASEDESSALETAARVVEELSQVQHFHENKENSYNEGASKEREEGNQGAPEDFLESAASILCSLSSSILGKATPLATEKKRPLPEELSQEEKGTTLCKEEPTAEPGISSPPKKRRLVVPPSLERTTSGSDSKVQAQLVPSPPTRLAMTDDEAELNQLHCFVRAELLELFVLPDSSVSKPLRRSSSLGTDDSSSSSVSSKTYTEENDDEQSVGSSSTISASTTAIGGVTSLHASKSLGRIGIRCVHCAQARAAASQGNNGGSGSFVHNTNNKDACPAPMSTFYPKSISELYRLVCTWQRVHFRNCQHVPSEVREQYDELKRTDKKRGKTQYWITSAIRLGLVDNNEGGGGGVRYVVPCAALQQ